MPPLSKIWSHFMKLGHEATYKQERAQCNYCSHKLLTAANHCEQHLKKYNGLSEVEGNLNDEIRECDEESDNGSNESDTTIELYELDGYEND
ncbi:12335_t:CDS:2 [Entrophospora sp. SA101]|nr:12335_t:CDS:2 [Entrophospora sp. SA101]